MANPWNLLRTILPRDVMQVGSVQIISGDGTSNVLLVGGGVVRVTGSDFAVGQPVFIKGSRIVSAAPSLSVIQIDV